MDSDGRSSFTPINKTGGLMLVPHPPQKRDVLEMILPSLLSATGSKFDW
jgi:hypothetical protein